jgi:hypothetical protein
MSTGTFETPGGLDGLDSGTSVLLTGDDEAALKSVFSQLVAAQDGERSVVLSTEATARTVQRECNGATRGAGDRTLVLTAEGPARGDAVREIDDITDLTGLGMEFSSLLGTAQQDADRFRTGIFLCSAIASELDDTRSLYRFLNSTFMTELRRGDGIGVCAIDTSADIGADVNSVVSGLKTSFNVHIDVTAADRTNATVTVSGRNGGEQTVEIPV